MHRPILRICQCFAPWWIGGGIWAACSGYTWIAGALLAAVIVTLMETANAKT